MHKIDRSAGTIAARVIRVVIADPRRLFREALRACLDQRPDIEVVGVAGDAHSARDQVDARHPDVILLGEALGNSGTSAAIAALVSVDGSSRVCVVAGSTSSQRILAAIAAGARAYVTKDKRIADVVDAVLAVARGEMVLPASAWGSLSARILAHDTRDPIRISNSPLTRRESQVARLMAEGRTNRSIAVALEISPETARTHVHHIVRKINARSRVQAAAVITRELLRTRAESA